ncbi:hypothetical protein HY416_01245 [Candidatus Kaiserbacteria bacterium]|nr:hypothetical protein [Candidatus Kaiserbacteria bacterium]
MRNIQDSAAFGFIFCIVLLSVISIFGVWEFLARDVIGKSFWSIGLLAAVAAIVMVAGRFIDKHQTLTVSPGSVEAVDAGAVINPAFTAIRHLTLTTLIVFVSLLGLVGILAIWEILEGDTVYKSLATMGIGAFSSFVVVVTCLDRENHKWLRREDGKKSGMGLGTMIFLTLLGLWVLSSFLSLF